MLLFIIPLFVRMTIFQRLSYFFEKLSYARKVYSFYNEFPEMHILLLIFSICSHFGCEYNYF